jgi:CoA-transferase family III
VFQSCYNSKRGVIYERENCFGWDGPWAHRSGWQPTSDANCGIATGFARAMGHDEAVIPLFPNSDYCTGIAGSCAVLQAIIEQAESGGSYLVDASLNYYSRWLAKDVGGVPSRDMERCLGKKRSTSFSTLAQHELYHAKISRHDCER